MKFLNDDTVKQKFATAKKLADVDPAEYDAIFYVGGLGPVLDLAFDPVNAKLASQVSELVVVASLPRLSLRRSSTRQER